MYPLFPTLGAVEKVFNHKGHRVLTKGTKKKPRLFILCDLCVFPL